MIAYVTEAENDLSTEFKKSNQVHRHRLTLRYAKWSTDCLWRSLQEADLVVIPQVMNDKTRNAKSSNRLVESMWAGRFVVANPIPSYQEFGDWAILDERISDGLSLALTRQESLTKRIVEAQGHIETNYSIRAIGARWESALNLVE